MNRYDADCRESLDVFPTGVGMNRGGTAGNVNVMSVPHRRGDEPSGKSIRRGRLRCSPQAWG